MLDNKKPIMVFGIPRSGTTWLAKMLSASPELEYIHEPDNERHTFIGYEYKRGIERFPYISASQDHDAYKTLFDIGLHKPYASIPSFCNKLMYKSSFTTKYMIEYDLIRFGKNPNPDLRLQKILYPLIPKDIGVGKRRLVKSVHAVLSIPFLLKQFDVLPVVIFRHPASALSSYLYMDNPDIDRRVYENEALMADYFPEGIKDFELLKKDRIALAGLQIGIFYQVLSKVIQQFPEIIVVKHEDLCLDPVAQFKELYHKLGIDWTADIEARITQTNTAGTGYAVNRVGRDQIDVWKKRLKPEQISACARGFAAVPGHLYEDFKTLQ